MDYIKTEEKFTARKFTCLICGKTVSVGFYFCNDCAIKFDLADDRGKLKPPREWPDWARELYNGERRIRRQEAKIRDREERIIDDEDNEDDYLD